MPDFEDRVFHVSLKARPLPRAWETRQTVEGVVLCVHILEEVRLPNGSLNGWVFTNHPTDTPTQECAHTPQRQGVLV